MKKIPLLSIIVISFVFAGCSSTSKTAKLPPGVWVNNEKYDGKPFKNILVLVMSRDIEARAHLENALATFITSRGVGVVKSLTLMPVSLDDPKIPTKEELLAAVKTSGCDAIFIASLLKKDESVHYSPGTEAYTWRPYYAWGGNYLGYYSNWYPSVSTPEYYKVEQQYFMLGNFYDIASEEIMWSVQSEVFDPKSITKFTSTYTQTLVKQLQKANLIRTL